ncbi:unnamed protein product [Owenia fusiformis]|uniref:Uncharacterized protein n=1 Tax=Owenia fusiformis TaxID=6347 RepID=A0A8S4PXY7_OWEFU|nr:unnamed protein product [Owenia fusiformis]
MLNDIPGGVFNRYQELYSLNISQNGRMETIHNDSFNGLKSLEHLDLQYLTSLKKIAPHSFSALASLRHLDLRGSYEVGLKQILLRLRSLPMNCTLDYLNLKHVNEVTDFEDISLPILRVLKRLQVKVLILDENRIVSIRPGYSEYLGSVKYLSLRRNYLHFYSGFANFIDFLFMYSVKVLHLGDNSYIPLKNKPTLNNTFSQTCTPLPQDMEEVYFNNMQVTIYYKLYVNGLCFGEPNKLRIFDLTGTSFWGIEKPIKG